MSSPLVGVCGLIKNTTVPLVTMEGMSFAMEAVHLVICWENTQKEAEQSRGVNHDAEGPRKCSVDILIFFPLWRQDLSDSQR